MKKYILLNLPAHGHINPTLAVVKELVDRGNKVIYYATDEFKEKIKRTGAEYRDYKIDTSDVDIQKLADLTAMIEMLLLKTEALVPQLIEEIKKEKPDCIIHDSVCVWGKVIGNQLQIPTICSVTTFAMNGEIAKSLGGSSPLENIKMIPKISKILMLKGRLRKKGIKIAGFTDMLMNEQKLNIVYTSKQFQPMGDSFGQEYQFVGPSISDRKENMKELENINKNKTVIYISLGTIMNQNTTFYTNCFEALKDVDATFILSAGGNTDINTFKDIPKNFIVKNYVSQLEVLSIADLFITHGGMNSVHEGLYYKVPLIVVPQQKEQQVVANRVHECGAGIYIKNIEVTTIRDSVNKILIDSKYKDNALKISNSLINAGGYKKAVNKIEAYVNMSKLWK